LTSAGEIFGLAAAIVAVGGAAITIYQAMARRYRQTIGSRRALARQLYQLAAGTTIRWVEERLGTPAFTREFQALPGTREMVYYTGHAWVQVLADTDDAVVRFSITVTDPRFRFQIRDLTNHQLTARLGHTHFADAGTQLETQGQSLRIGAHNHEYAEAYWFGNPGNYQWYVLSHNDAVGVGTFTWSVSGHGMLSFQTGVLESRDGTHRHPAPTPDDLATFRANTTINTFTVLGPWRAATDGSPLGKSSLAEPRGPDSTQVRVIVPTPRERRLRRRRARRWNRKTLREMKRQPQWPGTETITNLHSGKAE
jgi:hypothetical protein